MYKRDQKLISTYARQYNELIQLLKPRSETNATEWLWDSWCEHVAENQPDIYDNASHVSKLHTLACTGETI